MEQVLGLFKAGAHANAPFLVQLTPVARNYSSPLMIMAMINAAAKTYPKAVYSVHLDHGNEVHAFDAIKSNQYQSVMIDASHDDFENNIKRTSKVVKAAHKRGVFVEAELGVLSGVEDDISIDEKDSKYTNPYEVAEFVARTKCDSIAVAVGTSHGAYKFREDKEFNLTSLKKYKNASQIFPSYFMEARRLMMWK